jgi:ubiquitin-activating enzyme E1-like protein 2
MVGCGAIGCEMLKNYALLGVGCGTKGRITITDNDIIEKSNLNRQFLFRPGDIRQSKAVTASNATNKINPDIVVKSFQEKVCPQTENDIFNDNFFKEQDICVNALDNIEARRYMDSRCVTNQKALLESGTLGSKGHVQVIIPHLTESYTTTRDPQDEDIPYCTLKSFPANIEHCIQWARDKFESSFTIKPISFRKFFTENQNVEQTINLLQTQPNLVIDGSVQIAKIMRDHCFDWSDCIRLARVKFEKYFSNKAKTLLHCYPLDHKLEDSSPFWKLPKRPPYAIKFDIKNELHLKFIKSCARLYADIYHVTVYVS